MNPLWKQLRPKSLYDIIGQRHIVRDLRNRLNNGIEALPDAMLFYGPSGTGKTSVALLISKLILAPSSQNCIRCKEDCKDRELCKDIDEMRSDFVQFVYADIKDQQTVLRDKNGDIPIYNKDCKVMIVENAQAMKDSSGKQFILHSLDAKRKGFLIFCTSNIGLMDDELQSRLLPYEFNPIDEKMIWKYMRFVIRKMNLIDTIPEKHRSTFLDTVLYGIAESANGNMRKALNYLDRCMWGELWTADLVEAAFHDVYIHI